MSVVFVNSKRAISSNRGSWLIRGVSVSNMLNASLASCDDDVSHLFPIRFMVHVKNQCRNFMNISEYNVFDGVDSKKRVDLSAFDGEIRATGVANHNNMCGNRVCVRIPHHDNLECNVHTDLQSRLAGADEHRGKHRRPVIGIVGNEPSITGLNGYRVLLERDFVRPCAFFDRIDIAIAWKKRQSSLYPLPCERFTNPISWNIPTIGYPYASYKVFNESNDFICSDLKCVYRKIKEIHTGSMWTQLRALRRKVLLDTSKEHVVHLYRTLFSTLEAKH